MREILFRGKREDNGEWIGGLPFGSIYGGFSNGAICAIRQTVEKYGDIHDVVIETVGEYTGLKDQNGKKIFEGDIVSSNKRKTWIGMGEVWFGNSAFWCGEREWAKLLRVVCLEDEQAEVIGNIHDNPELLEDEE